MWRNTESDVDMVGGHAETTHQFLHNGSRTSTTGVCVINAHCYEFIGSGAPDVTKPYNFIRFGDVHGPKPYKFIGFRWAIVEWLGRSIQHRPHVTQ